MKHVLIKFTTRLLLGQPPISYPHDAEFFSSLLQTHDPNLVAQLLSEIGPGLHSVLQASQGRIMRPPSQQNRNKSKQ